MHVLRNVSFYVYKVTSPYLFFFFFNDTATTEIYTLSLHDALPISGRGPDACSGTQLRDIAARQPNKKGDHRATGLDRKSTRLNSSHLVISYAVFCLKKKKIKLNRVYNNNTYEMSLYVKIVCTVEVT